MSVKPVKEKDFDYNKWRFERHPIYLNPHCVVLLQLFKTADSLHDLWTLDYINGIADTRKAARQFVKQMSDEASPAFWWELREAIADEIKNHNDQFNTDFPIDRPKE